MKHTGKGHRTKTGTGSSPPAPTPKRRRPRPTGNQMTCKVAQNTLLSSQTTTTHEADTNRTQPAAAPRSSKRRTYTTPRKNTNHPQTHTPKTQQTSHHPRRVAHTHKHTTQQPKQHTKHTKHPASNNKSLTTRRVATAEPGTSHKHTPETGPRLRHRRPSRKPPKTETEDPKEPRAPNPGGHGYRFASSLPDGPPAPNPGGHGKVL
ncbi:hypothetical protein PSSU_1155 [Pseudoscardovia suis]|uniref:Uncharacterized protein n=1 Tax=Pseudoscardovia suis TaxID=987063 RepID=A0A261EV38_9BIFI|nr:hypothetical protein PSSU_1155 [Pseudoscardovia suis]